MTKMNPAVKALWISELRSGNWKQTNGALSRIDRFCCLGVLCELAYREGVAVDRYVNEPLQYISYDDETGTLPPSVRDWAGLSDIVGGHNPMTEERGADGDNLSLAQLNDRGASFEQIASFIERDL